MGDRAFDFPGRKRGALGRTRTCDQGFRKPLLCPLSYEGIRSRNVSSPTSVLIFPLYPCSLLPSSLLADEQQCSLPLISEASRRAAGTVTTITCRQASRARRPLDPSIRAYAKRVSIRPCGLSSGSIRASHWHKCSVSKPSDRVGRRIEIRTAYSTNVLRKSCRFLNDWLSSHAPGLRGRVRCYARRRRRRVFITSFSPRPKVSYRRRYSA